MLTPLLTRSQAAKLLNVCPNTLTRMIESHQVEVVDLRKPGGKYAILRIKADSLRNPADPAFHCQDWRDLKTRRDPMTGDPWPPLNEAPLKIGIT